MTYGKALKELKRQVKCWKNGTSFAYNLQPLEVAVSALEKQIPQKPNFEGDGYDDSGNLIYDTWICPNCGDRYEVEYETHRYCPMCGQFIDWSDTE